MTLAVWALSRETCYGIDTMFRLDACHEEPQGQGCQRKKHGGQPVPQPWLGGRENGQDESEQREARV